VTAVDLSLPMLTHDRSARPPSACADATALPFRAGTFGAVVAGFSLTHVPDVDRAVSECARVLAPGRALLASAFTRRYPNPAQAAVEAVLAAAGWEPPSWYLTMKGGTDTVLTDPLRLLDLASGFTSARVSVAQHRSERGEQPGLAHRGIGGRVTRWSGRARFGPRRARPAGG
jgi:SAM-dependent methyltransferase